MLKKAITFFGLARILACDGHCYKAWGINSRPRIDLDESNPDDYCYLADDELGNAPANPGTYEGECGKPAAHECPNKWCARECERSVIVKPDEEIVLPDFSQRRYNIARMIH